MKVRSTTFKVSIDSDKFEFHCFRHTFAMQLLDKGVDIPTIAFFLGHKFLGSSLTYLHCTKEHLEEVIAKLER